MGSGQNQNSPFGFISLSAFIHASVILGLALIPTLKLTQHGSDSVEVVTDMSGGGGTTTTEEPVVIPPSAEPPAPVTPVAQPTIAPTPAPVKEVKPPKVKPAKPAAVAQAKKVVPVDMDSKIDKVIDETENEVDSYSASESVATVEEKPQAEPTEEAIEETVSAAAAEAVAKQEEKTKDEDVEPLPAPQAVAVKNVKEDIKETLESSPAPSGSGQGSGGGGATSGAPTGEVRSYLEVKQMPGNVPPQYPVQARRQGWQGEVVLNYFVTPEGKVKDATIAKSSGFGELDQAALRAVSKFRYVPGQEGWTTHPVIFNLKGELAPAPSRLRTAGKSASNNE